ncbi:response regulator transcription factor [Fredinandcohnia sp. 179-A 10B2 NHS]|uniref:response regulator transcription factor n=1 Tax=Fredinandcohnia sp. 179-A 10B2 NHS TaxID=3235176 RepID=UPI0039A0E400
MQLSLKANMESILLKGLHILWSNKDAITREWRRLLQKDEAILEQSLYAKKLVVQIEKALIDSCAPTITTFFKNLSPIKVPLSPYESNQFIMFLTYLENIVHKITRTTMNSTYHEYQAIHYLFSKISKELLANSKNESETDENVRLSDLTLQQLLSTLQMKIEATQNQNPLTDYENEAVLLFNQWILRSTNFNNAVENIASGFVNCLPFNRCALFSHEREKGVGLMGYHVKDIEKITENITNVPSVLHNIKKLFNLQPIYIANAAQAFPEEYVEKFQLESVVMVPLYASSKNKLLGIAIVDCGEGTYFELSQELVIALMRFGQSAAELLEAHWDGRAPNLSDSTTPTLSPREIDVLQLMANGLSISEAAEELQLSSYTVRDYVSAIIRKLNAKNRTHAAVIGAAKGLIRL